MTGPADPVPGGSVEAASDADPARVLVLAIGGATRSGKSSLAEHLKGTVLPGRGFREVAHLCLDVYQRPVASATLRLEGGRSRQVADWEAPSSVLWGRWRDAAVRQLQQLQARATPTRRACLLLEGFLLYHEPTEETVPQAAAAAASAAREVRELCDLRIFLDVSEEVARQRRVYPERRYGGEQSREEFDQLTWPSYLSFGSKHPLDAVVLDGNAGLAERLAAAEAALAPLLG